MANTYLKYKVDASNGGGGGGAVGFKAGKVAGASFSGNPLTYAVVFSTAYANTNYVIHIDSDTERSWSFSSQATTGFTINANAAAAIGGTVHWSTQPTGET